MLHLPPNQDVEVHQVLHLPRHEKPTLEHQSTRFPLRLPRKVTTMCENARGATTRAQSLEAPAADTQIQRACTVGMHIDDVERHECTVNSSELAGHARAEQRSKHTCFSITVRTPSVTTLFGEKSITYHRHSFKVLIQFQKRSIVCDDEHVRSQGLEPHAFFEHVRNHL